MNYFVESLAQLFGRAPQKHHATNSKSRLRRSTTKRKRVADQAELEALEAAHERTRHRHKWRNRRWATLIIINLCSSFRTISTFSWSRGH